MALDGIVAGLHSRLIGAAENHTGLKLRHGYRTLKRELRTIRKRRRDRNRYFLERTLSSKGVPHHIPKANDFLEDDTIMFLPGSPGRAEKIAGAVFDNIEYQENSRGFGIYKGTITGDNGETINVATMASQMGFSSLDIALGELHAMGVRAVVRVGTSGGTSDEVKIGDVVISDSATYDPLFALAQQYALNHVARPDPETLEALNRAGERYSRKTGTNVYTGPTYSKFSLRRGEFLLGPIKSAVYHAFVKALKATTGHIIMKWKLLGFLMKLKKCMMIQRNL